MKHKLSIQDGASATVRFQAVLKGEGGSWSVDLPSIEGLSQREMVEGTMDGFPFRTWVDGNGGMSTLAVSEPLRKAVGAELGSNLAIEVTRVGDEAEVRTPQDWAEALELDPEAHAVYEKVTPMARREWVRWVASAKQNETRERRIQVGIDKLKKGMKRPCCFPGINFVTKGLVEPEETWITLPGAKNSQD